MKIQEDRVLVVEDMPDWRNKLAGILRREGYAVQEVADFNEAVSQLESQIFDLAVIDIRLEDWNVRNIQGMKLIDEMLMRGIAKRTSVIVVTGYGTIELVREAFKKYEVFDFLDKGDFTIERFKRIVTDAIAGKQFEKKREALLETLRDSYEKVYAAIKEREAKYLEWRRSTIGEKKIGSEEEASQKRIERDLREIEEQYNEIRKKANQAKSLQELETMELEIIREGENWVASFSRLRMTQT